MQTKQAIEKLTWTKWISQFSELEKNWNLIPEPANILFREQIENYAKDFSLCQDQKEAQATAGAEKELLEFAEWTMKNYTWNGGTKYRNNKREYFDMPELYQIFQQSKQS